MKEIKAIISAYDEMDKTSTRAALATVVRVEGSSYRRTGARMLVREDGLWTGGISGGCLERDALKQAKFAIFKSTSSLVTYDTTEDDAHQIGVGLGCNGIIDVLFTPLDYLDKNNPVEVLKSCVLENRKTHILITVTGLKGLWKGVEAGHVMLYRKFSDLDLFDDVNIKRRLFEKIEKQSEINRSALFQLESTGEHSLSVFIEILPPEIHLIIMGNQYDIYPLARLSKEIGWQVTLVTNSRNVKSELLAVADRVVENDQLTEIVVDKYTAILLMSHDYKTDKINLVQSLLTGSGYIGMLGPRTRAEKIFLELASEAKPVSDENRQHIFAPAGLDIGALSPEEIALSLTAEIRAVFSNREGGFLKLRQTTIHERT